MATTTNLLLNNQDTGTNDNSWGVNLNTNFSKIDAKLGDMTTISTTSGTVTLSESQERVNIIKLTATLVGNLTLEFTGRGGMWVIWNATSGSFSVTAKVSGQTGVVVLQGDKTIVVCDGTDVREAGSLPTTISAIAALAVTDGNFIVGNGSTWVAESGTTVRTSLGLGTGNSPQFTGIEIGHASDTTITRSSAGKIAVEADVVPTLGANNIFFGTNTFNGDVTVGNDSGDTVVIKGTTVSAYGALLLNAGVPSSSPPQTGGHVLSRDTDGTVRWAIVVF